MSNLHSMVTIGILLVQACASFAAPPHYATWESFDTDSGLPSNKALCVLAADDAVWVGTDLGLARYDGRKWRTYTRRDGLAHDAVMSIAQDSQTGDIWLGTMGGLTRYSAGRFDTFNQLNSGLVNDMVYGVEAHPSGVWCATASGISRYELAGARWTLYNESNTPMHETWCYAVTASTDKIYVAVWGGGLLEYQIKRDHWRDYVDPDAEMELDLFRDDGLVHDVTSSVAYDAESRVWVGTYFGLSSYDGRKWRNFSSHDSPLVSNFINFTRARGEFCWLCTDNGLNATDRENWWTYRRDPDTGKGIATWRPSSGEPEQFTTDTIFPHNYILGLSFQGSDIWLATEDGVACGKLSVPNDAAQIKK